MAEKIFFNEVKTLSKLISDYIYSPEKLNEFFAERPQIESFQKAIDNRLEVNRNLLAEQLLEQNKKMNINSLNNIELIKSKKTFTVTTGHQICLFTGPLYSLYKIVSTINLTRKLKEHYPDNDFVPVFWMATEDHDFEEINHIYFKNEKLTWDSKQSGPVGRFELNDIQTFLNQVEEKINSELFRNLKTYYSSSSNLAEAHRKIIDDLFGEYGVVTIDADSKALKKEMIPIFKNELVDSVSFDSVTNSSSKLFEKGYKTQVNPREINLFYQENGLRERIIKEDSSYQILNTNKTFNEKEILLELENHPEKFSPNVILRPVYQEKILPNLAYIGGPGELAYWLQLKETFESLKVSFPTLVLRNSAILMESKIQKKIDQLPFELKHYFKPEDELISKYVNDTSEISFEKEISEIEKVFEIAKDKATQIDFSLEKSVIAELKRAQNSFNKIQKKVTKAEKVNHEVAINRIKAIKESIFPSGTFQERKSNVLEFYHADLIKNLIDDLISLEDSITLIPL